MLNLSDEIPEPMLVDAAFYGIPCVGSRSSAVQTALWPDLRTEAVRGATELARKLLTDLAFCVRVSEGARRECHSLYSPDVETSIVSLRRLHAQETADAPVLSG